MQTTAKKSHVYDYAVIGSGLAGLCVASAISRATSNVLLLESGDLPGGLNRTIQSPAGPVNNGLRFLPDTAFAHKAIAFLEMLLQQTLSPVGVESPPLTFENGHLQAFVGFGDLKPQFYDEIAYFTNTRSLMTTLAPHEWTQLLFQHYQGEFLPRSYVTRFQVENGRMTSLTVNGQKTIQAQNFIYCGPVKGLKTLLPEGFLSPRALQKLSKNEYWTAVCLDLFHSHQVTDSAAMHVLNGTTQDDLGPCAGKFLPALKHATESGQYSQWVTFLNDEEAEDSEVIGAALKKIKRQIKRAFPEALDGLKFERILVVPSYAGNGDLKVSANQTLAGLENLWIGSTQMAAKLSSQKNLLGALLQAELITSSLGCHPLGVQIEATETAESSETLSPDTELDT
jgi:hypothetical protein